MYLAFQKEVVCKTIGLRGYDWVGDNMFRMGRMCIDK